MNLKLIIIFWLILSSHLIRMQKLKSEIKEMFKFKCVQIHPNNTNYTNKYPCKLEFDGRMLQHPMANPYSELKEVFNLAHEYYLYETRGDVLINPLGNWFLFENHRFTYNETAYFVDRIKELDVAFRVNLYNHDDSEYRSYSGRNNIRNVFDYSLTLPSLFRKLIAFSTVKDLKYEKFWVNIHLF